jgi:hypothetical protein
MTWLDANMPGICTNAAVAENNLYDGVTVFPNPGTGKFNVESSMLKIEKAEVLDLFGRELLSLKPNPDGMSFDLSAQPGGIYVLKIYSGGSFALHKIIKAD